MKTFVKDPSATLDYSVDWSAFLVGSNNDTILTVTWVVPAGAGSVTVTDNGYASSIHTGFISGGTLGESYRVTSRITTAGGLINDASFYLLIRDT